MQKRTEITIETESFRVVSRRRKGTLRWCTQCAKNVVTLTVDEAAAIGFAEASLLHFLVTPAGRLMICSNSLAIERTETCS